MPSKLTITTHWKVGRGGGMWECNVRHTCPGVHAVAEHPDVVYVVSREITDPAALARHTIGPGQVLGAVPPQIHPSGHIITTRVTDPAALEAFAGEIGPGEVLGTTTDLSLLDRLPAPARVMPMLNEQQLGDWIDAHYQRPGDRLFRMERLPWYDVPSQNTDRQAWLAGHPDTAAVETWAQVLADDTRRGLISQRVRVLSARLTDDEAMSCHIALPITSRHEEVRVLHRGEHPVPDQLDHDYWIIQPASGPVSVLAMQYSPGGAFVGARIVPPAEHGPYLAEQRLTWAIAEPFGSWWARHGELHRQTAA